MPSPGRQPTGEDFEIDQREADGERRRRLMFADP